MRGATLTPELLDTRNTQQLLVTTQHNTTRHTELQEDDPLRTFHLKALDVADHGSAETI